jgi:hypothetical protein
MPIVGKSFPQPLPDNEYTDGTKVRQVYDCCLLLEKQDTWPFSNTEHNKNISEEMITDMTPCVAACVLGYALLFTLDEAAADTLTCKTIPCHNHEEL